MENSNRYALLERGLVHTDNLTLPDAQEMHERYTRIFNTIQWDIVPMAECENTERLIGYLERFRANAIRYHSV